MNMANQEGGLGHQPDDYFIPPDVRGPDDDKEVTNPHFEYSEEEEEIIELTDEIVDEYETGTDDLREDTQRTFNALDEVTKKIQATGSDEDIERAETIWEAAKKISEEYTDIVNREDTEVQITALPEEL